MLIMENAEEVLQLLERFSKLKQKDIPRELDDYLSFVAKTGDPVYPWSMLKHLFREKLTQVIKDFYESTPSIADLPQDPNVDAFNYETMKNGLLEELELFNAAPFTVQRICELLTDPRKQYSRIDKFMRAIEKNILVVSTIEPGRKRSSSLAPDDESLSAESIDSVINGDLSSESVDSDEQDLNFADLAAKLSSETKEETGETTKTENEEKTDIEMKECGQEKPNVPEQKPTCSSENKENAVEMKESKKESDIKVESVTENEKEIKHCDEKVDSKTEAVVEKVEVNLEEKIEETKIEVKPTEKIKGEEDESSSPPKVDTVKIVEMVEVKPATLKLEPKIEESVIESKDELLDDMQTEEQVEEKGKTICEVKSKKRSSTDDDSELSEDKPVAKKIDLDLAPKLKETKPLQDITEEIATEVNPPVISEVTSDKLDEEIIKEEVKMVEKKETDEVISVIIPSCEEKMSTLDAVIEPSTTSSVDSTSSSEKQEEEDKLPAESEPVIPLIDSEKIVIPEQPITTIAEEEELSSSPVSSDSESVASKMEPDTEEVLTSTKNTPSTAIFIDNSIISTTSVPPTVQTNIQESIPSLVAASSPSLPSAAEIQSIAEISSTIPPALPDTTAVISIATPPEETAMQATEGLEMDTTNLTEFRMEVDVDYIDDFALDEDVSEPMDQ